MIEEEQFRLDAGPDTGFLAVNEVAGRITVILGANGSGKSSLLRSLRLPGMSRRPRVNIEGGRSILIQDQVQLFSPISANQTSEMATLHHRNKQHDLLTHRINDALVSVIKAEEQEKVSYVDVVEAWERNGQVGKMPRRPPSPLERLTSMFGAVFPEIAIRYRSSNATFECESRGATYQVSRLSDGEKQAFCLLADVAVLSDPRSIVIVDEPELNLNAQLACRLWDSIEACLPNATFVYATHCLPFAMRASVEVLYALSRGPKLAGC